MYNPITDTEIETELNARNYFRAVTTREPVQKPVEKETEKPVSITEKISPELLLVILIGGFLLAIWD